MWICMSRYHRGLHGTQHTPRLISHAHNMEVACSPPKWAYVVVAARRALHL